MSRKEGPKTQPPHHVPRPPLHPKPARVIELVLTRLLLTFQELHWRVWTVGYSTFRGLSLPKKKSYASERNVFETE